jgi:hypothetical protein
MEMFGFIFWWRKPHRQEWIPPTEKQLRYARTIGLDVPEGTSKIALSYMLARFEWGRDKRTPPTRKQIGYAKSLGIDVPSDATRRDVSRMIDEAIEADPVLRRKRQEKEDRKYEEEFGPEALAALVKAREWDDFEGGFALVIYTWRKDIVVDVLQIDEVSLDEKDIIWIEGQLPKYQKKHRPSRLGKAHQDAGGRHPLLREAGRRLLLRPDQGI